ncbi:MAG TPA: hydroxymethylbilane synthase [Planctomycetes bacterium]|nr:hydroxymethylbilane synthase [Fuerstiella sp.]HIK96001.1 hydroxymethylbilane synthase [Planctomycetota bacterium]
MSPDTIRIATRSSKLALWQAHHVKSLITEACDVSVEIVHISTEGDQNQTDPLRQFAGTGLFTKEVQRSVLDGDTHIAVHSLKDLPTESANGLVLAGIPQRAPRFDAVLLPADTTEISSVHTLPAQARIGTGSPRRQAQLLHLRPDLRVLEIRGNVETRIAKLDNGEYDAIILAEAGLRRLDLQDRISFLVQPPEMYPAVGQGAIGIECRSDDKNVQQILNQITDHDVACCTRAERSLLLELRAGCHAPLGALTDFTDGRLKLTGVLLSSDGTERLEAASEGPPESAVEIGVTVAQQLLSAGGQKLVDGE